MNQYTFVMLKEWLALGNYPILNKQGIRLRLLQLKFLTLSLRKPVKNTFSELDLIENSQGDVWINFNKWLRYQIKYISAEFWARSPIIQGVALVNLNEEYARDLSLISLQKKREINEIAAVYSQTFRFPQEPEFRNWIVRNSVILNSFPEYPIKSSDASDVLVEIGPGLGAVISLCLKSNWKKIYSLDTFEMQSIFGAVVNKYQSHYSRYQAISINDTRNKKPFKIDGESLTVLAFWSFTELKIEERTQYFEVFRSAKQILIGTNENFEGVNNFEYIENMASSFGMEFTWKSMADIFETDLPKYQRNHRIYNLRTAV
jgi:hypothetical protein